MTAIAGFELFATDLPLRLPFKHSAATRDQSESLFLRCVLDDGTAGWGESLPRTYVTDENRDDAFDVLAGTILPALVGTKFDALADVEAFLADCDGRAPSSALAAPHTAAWCGVYLALLDAFSRGSGTPPLHTEPMTFPPALRYSGVISAETGWKRALLLAAHRLFRFRAIKLKVGPTTDARDIQLVRRWLGDAVDLRVDANMAFTVEQALAKLPELARAGVRSFEQPLAADDLDGMAHLVATTGLDVMADESFSTRESLARLVVLRAATAVNARISKCGGLVATLARCREALALGLVVQIGCQVGESSLLSAAQLRLAAAVGNVRYLEGCFGTLLLAEDPGRPVLRFGRGGRPPAMPSGPGFGIEIDRAIVARHSNRHVEIGRILAPRSPRGRTTTDRGARPVEIEGRW